MNYCHFRTELGFGAHAASWVVSVLAWLDLGPHKSSLCTIGRRRLCKEVQCFLSVSLTRVQLRYLGVTAFESAVKDPKEKLWSSRELRTRHCTAILACSDVCPGIGFGGLGPLAGAAQCCWRCAALLPLFG